MGLTTNRDILELLEHVAALKERVEQLEETVFKCEPETPEITTWDAVREKRDQLLKSSDWTMIPGVTVDQREWAAYRQVLRDLPQTFKLVDVSQIVWPKEPPIAGPNTTPVE